MCHIGGLSSRFVSFLDDSPVHHPLGKVLNALPLQGSTRAFPPHHPLIPVDYQLTGQPVLIGGTMGTCSYVLTGTEQGMMETFGSTCHGAVSNIFFTLTLSLLFLSFSLSLWGCK